MVADGVASGSAELTLPASFGAALPGSQLELLTLVAPRRMPYPIPIDPVRARPPRRGEAALFAFDDEADLSALMPEVAQASPAAEAVEAEPELPFEATESLAVPPPSAAMEAAEPAVAEAAARRWLLPAPEAVAEEELLPAAVESPAAPLFDLEQLDRPFSIAPRQAHGAEAAAMDLTLPPNADPLAQLQAEVPDVQEPASTGPTGSGSPAELDVPGRPPLPPTDDPLIATIDAIIADAYRKRQADGEKAETAPGAGFPQIPALPDYLILAPDKAGDGASAGAESGSAAASPDAHRSSSPAGARPEQRPPSRRSEGTSQRIAALQGLPLLEPLPLDPNAQPLPELDLPTAPAVPVSRLKALQNGHAPHQAPVQAHPNDTAPPDEPTPTTSPPPGTGHVPERETVMVGLPLLEPLDDVAGGPGTS